MKPPKFLRMKVAQFWYARFQLPVYLLDSQKHFFDILNCESADSVLLPVKIKC